MSDEVDPLEQWLQEILEDPETQRIIALINEPGISDEERRQRIADALLRSLIVENNFLGGIKV